MAPEKLFNVGMLILMGGFSSENQFFTVKYDPFAGKFMGTMWFFAVAITNLTDTHVTGRRS